MDQVDALIIGGQGTFNEGKCYTEYPDRELSLEYVMKVRDIVERFRYSVVICSGGHTQTETPMLSEAESFLNIWNETQTKPACPVVLDKVALDSAENVIFGLMAFTAKGARSETGPNRVLLAVAFQEAENDKPSCRPGYRKMFLLPRSC